MTFPTVESVTPFDFDSDATSHSITLPTVAADDMLVALCAVDLSAVWTTPAGLWHNFGEFFADDNPSTRIFGFRCVGGETSSSVDFVTDTSERGGILLYRISGAYATLASALEFLGADQASPPDPPDLTPSWGALDTLWIAGAANSTGTAVTASPTSYSAIQVAGSIPLTGSSDAAVYAGHRSLNAASENPGAFTTSGGFSVTIAIRPAAAVAEPYRRPTVSRQAIQRSVVR